MKDEQKVTNILYNLILNPNTREWERKVLVETKNDLENKENFWDKIAALEAVLRPLALRNNLTPDVADFYLQITNDPVGEKNFDWSKHTLSNLDYQERAIFAGGCFWCMVEPFETQSGIVSVLSGYTGGDTTSPNYDQVSSGLTGHVEAVEIIFDRRIISYEELVELYWQLTDPTDAFGQFQDRGEQYQPIIFVQNEKQRQVAEKSKNKLIESEKYKQPIVTQIKKADTFWPAENYHQQFYKKQPKRYKQIKRVRHQLLLYQQLKSKLRQIFKGRAKK